LPLIDGYETTRIIRQYEKETGKHIPIVALTAHVDEENRQRCINTGMNAVFVKPLIENIAEDILKAFVPSYKCLQIDNFNKDEMQISYLVEGKVIDIAEAKKVLGNKPKFIKHMIDLLKTSLKEDIKNIKKAHKQNDIELLKKLAHKTKGAACYCGAVRLKTIAGYLEDAIYTPNLNIDLIEKLYNQFINEIDAVLEANI
jgi:CheY-like chemotaxis protein